MKNRERNTGLKIPFAGLIAAAIRSGSVEVCKDVAKKLADHYLVGKAPKQILLIFTHICFAVDGIKQQVLGYNGSVKISNHIMRLASAYYAGTVSNLSDSDITELKSMAAQHEAEGSKAGWMYPKFEILFDFLRHRLQAMQFVANIRVPSDPRIMEMYQQSLPDLEQLPGQILAELLALRHYGVKSCYFQDGMIHASNQAWVFHDPDEWRKHFGDLDFRPNILAMIHLAERASITDLSVSLHTRKTSQYNLNAVDSGFQGYASWTIDDRGSLDYSLGLNVLPLVDVFRQVGRAEEYNLVLLAQVLRLYDLLVPLSVVQKMPQFPAFVVPRPRGLLDRFFRSRQLPSIPNLLLPRIQYLENPQYLQSELDREVEQAEEDTRKRTRREHEVVWHVRKLPVGRHPTAAAHEQAREAGIELAENETFVRKHKRGKGADIRGHRAVSRTQLP